MPKKEIALSFAKEELQKYPWLYAVNHTWELQRDVIVHQNIRKGSLALPFPKGCRVWLRCHDEHFDTVMELQSNEYFCTKALGAGIVQELLFRFKRVEPIREAFTEIIVTAIVYGSNPTAPHLILRAPAKKNLWDMCNVVCQRKNLKPIPNQRSFM